MNWLKTVGSVVLKIVGLWTGLDPLLSRLIPGADTPGTTTNKIYDKLDLAIQQAGLVEQVFVSAFGPDNKMPSEKLKALTPYVAQLIQNSEALSGFHVKQENEAKFEIAVAGIASNLADALNCFGK
jgi:ribosomal protein L1